MVAGSHGAALDTGHSRSAARLPSFFGVMLLPRVATRGWNCFPKPAFWRKWLYYLDGSGPALMLIPVGLLGGRLIYQVIRRTPALLPCADHPLSSPFWAPTRCATTWSMWR